MVEIKEAIDCEYYIDEVGHYHIRKKGENEFWLHITFEGLISEALENQAPLECECGGEINRKCSECGEEY